MKKDERGKKRSTTGIQAGFVSDTDLICVTKMSLFTRELCDVG